MWKKTKSLEHQQQLQKPIKAVLTDEETDPKQ